MWTFRIKGGECFRNGEFKSLGYSGHGEFKNDPSACHLAEKGPIPPGRWLVGELREEDVKHGPFVLTLVPEFGTETFGRSGFLIHGDSIKDPGNGSRGCIILSRRLREKIWASGDRHFVVERGDFKEDTA